MPVQMMPLNDGRAMPQLGFGLWQVGNAALGVHDQEPGPCREEPHGCQGAAETQLREVSGIASVGELLAFLENKLQLEK